MSESAPSQALAPAASGDRSRSWILAARPVVNFLAVTLMVYLGAGVALAQRGAAVPWTTYEAETMLASPGVTTTGPSYTPNTVECESSGRQCCHLTSTGDNLAMFAVAPANSMVVRYSVPDSATGGGTDYTLSLYINGTLVQELPVTSKYSWLYGTYGTGNPAYTNNPAIGTPRNFYDEVRVNGLNIQAGDVIQLEKDAGDTATNYTIDLVDLENVAAPLTQPVNSYSLTADYGADNTGVTDATTALQSCVSDAATANKTAWIPPGTYKITGNITLPSNAKVQGAGMWYTTFMGDPTVYNTASRRVTFSGNGSNIHLADFAIIGKLDHRIDNEANDGLGGGYSTGSTISRVWVEHVKTGAWIVNSSGLVIDSCRFRDTIADGCNLQTGMRGCIVTNCTARGNGDDCFAMWPASTGSYTPGLNVFTHCTAELPFLANGGAIYGGTNNAIQDCVFRDLPYGCGVLISSTFAVGTSIFRGTTLVQNCDLNRCGGFDPNGNGWRGAVQICVQRTNITGVNINNLNISNSVSDAFSIVQPGNSTKIGLTNAAMSYVTIPNYGLGVGGRNGLWAVSGTRGSLTVSNCAVVELLNSASAFTFNFVTNVVPQNIPGFSMNADGSVTLTYATVPGAQYHLESSPSLAPATWTPVNGSTNSATGMMASFTDPNLSGDPQLYYRVASP